MSPIWTRSSATATRSVLTTWNIARASEKGYLVTYNHPAWSMQDARDYIGLEGIWCVEMFNGEYQYAFALPYP